MKNNRITGDTRTVQNSQRGGGGPEARRLYRTGIACNSIIFHIFLIFFDLIFDRVDYFQAPRVCKAIFLVFGVIIF